MLEPEKVQLSPMQKTWILDLDGTIVVHDGPYILGKVRSSVFLLRERF